MNKYLYCYFGNIVPNRVDIPGHFIYQPFLIEEICNKLSGSEDYKVDIYSYTHNIDRDIDFSKEIYFNHFLSNVNGIANNIGGHLGTKINRRPYINLGKVFRRINEDYYDFLILKARFRNPSTHAKKLYDVKKFEKIIEIANVRNIPVLIVDTDLSLPDYFITDVINSHNNIKIIGLGNISKAYPNLSKDHILSDIPLYGIDKTTIRDIYNSFKENEQIIEKCKNFSKTFVFYGNIAFSNYKSGHTKNKKILDYLLKLPNENFFEKIKGTIIGKVEDPAFLRNYSNIKRYDRESICDSLCSARISVNISKELYDITHFVPARVSEAWLYGIIPLSYTPEDIYDKCKGALFTNYHEFLECVRLYLVDTSAEDYYKMFMSIFNKCLTWREE